MDRLKPVLRKDCHVPSPALRSGFVPRKDKRKDQIATPARCWFAMTKLNATRVLCLLFISIRSYYLPIIQMKVMIRFLQILYTSVALLLLLTPLYAETVHHALHTDANQANHHDDGDCTVCHFTNSNIAAQPETVIDTLPVDRPETTVSQAIASPTLVLLYSSAQPRSPPTNA